MSTTTNSSPSTVFDFEAVSSEPVSYRAEHVVVGLLCVVAAIVFVAAMGGLVAWSAGFVGFTPAGVSVALLLSERQRRLRAAHVARSRVRRS